MNRNMMLLLLAAVLVFTAPSVFARGNGQGQAFERGAGPHMMQGQRFRDLDLSEAQQDKIFKISQEYRQKMYDSRKDPVKRAELRAEHFKAVYAVLTAEQKAKLASNDDKAGPDCFGGGFRGSW